ncbi:MAG: glycosyltransferase family 4 protein [Candidatus Tectomicrobia bacterium]|nr:glycosyltransferase family 4 protein [Candidatus Tectomicrobia bacterium]
MKILALAGNYPHLGHPYSGIFNERCVEALNELCDRVEVLAPRPFVPPWLSSIQPRWKSYAQIQRHQVRNGIPVYRPAYLQIPWLARSFWLDPGAFLWCRRVAHNMHHHTRFDAIMSFDLDLSGGVAWRIGRELGIPASGWAFGDDVRVPRSSRLGRTVGRTIKHLDLVFYQSHELLEKAAGLAQMEPAQMPCHRHLVLPHGIPEPPALPRAATRQRVRSALGISDDQLMVLNVGRMVREKGMYELLNAISFAAARDPRIVCVMVGSKPDYDETATLLKTLEATPYYQDHIRLLPACRPHEVWEYLCATDMFAFPSHNEGMPNSLLEAMSMEVPSIAFAIPPILEIKAQTEALVLVPPFNSRCFGKEILHLATSPTSRARIGKIGKSQVKDRFMVHKNMAKALQSISQLSHKS